MDTRAKVKEIISKILRVPETRLNDEVKLRDIETWDSMNNVIILSSLENEFNITIPEDDLFDLDSVISIITEIDKLTH